MTIHFDSWQSALGFLALLGAALTAHWKWFLSPLIRRALAPYGERLEIVTRVVEYTHPAEYKDAQKAVYDGRELRGAI